MQVMANRLRLPHIYLGRVHHHRATTLKSISFIEGPCLNPTYDVKKHEHMKSVHPKHHGLIFQAGASGLCYTP